MFGVFVLDLRQQIYALKAPNLILNSNVFGAKQFIMC
jgi:hypothetical protein